MNTNVRSTVEVAPGPGASQPTPDRIFETLLFGHARVDSLKAAIDLDLFTAIAEGWHSSELLAERCGASERGMRVLCDFLVVNDFLIKTDDEYHLTPDTRLFLDARSPAYFGTVAKFVADRHNAESSATILECVRSGHPVRVTVDDVDQWRSFAEAMLPMATRVASACADVLDVARGGPLDILDVAASHGEYGLAIARKNAEAKIVGLDFAEVVAVASRRAREQGFGSRYTTIAGSAFDVALGGPYDIVLLPNFLHHFRPQIIERFLRRVAAAVKPGGRVVTVEFVPNADRVSPPAAAMFGMTMLTRNEGDAYTFAELSGMFRRAGFSNTRAFLAAPTPQTILVSDRP